MLRYGLEDQQEPMFQQMIFGNRSFTATIHLDIISFVTPHGPSHLTQLSCQPSDNVSSYRSKRISVIAVAPSDFLISQFFSFSQ